MDVGCETALRAVRDGFIRWSLGMAFFYGLFDVLRNVSSQKKGTCLDAQSALQLFMPAFHTVLFSSEYARFPSAPPPIAQVPRNRDWRLGGMAAMVSWLKLSRCHCAQSEL